MLADFTALMYREHGARHHMDVVVERTVFRVFLLDNTLQVDLAFWPEADFGATTPKFRLLFGTANEREQAPPPDARRLVALACVRHDLPAGEGRGLDRLPVAITTPFEETLVRGLDDLARAFRAVTGLLIAEIERVDVELAGTLAPLLRAPAS